MTQVRAFTANMESLRALCDKALATPEGIEINFTIEQCGSLDACKSRARSMQTTFTSLRARARDLTQSLSKSAYHNIKGPYDGLACLREPLPSNHGWRVRFLHAVDLLKDLEIIDLSTGKPIDTEKGREIEHLSLKLFSDFAHFTVADYDRLEELKPGCFIEMTPGFTLERWQVDGRRSIMDPVRASPPRGDYDPNARHVDLAEALTPGNLFEEGEEEG